MPHHRLAINNNCFMSPLFHTFNQITVDCPPFLPSVLHPSPFLYWISPEFKTRHANEYHQGGDIHWPPLAPQIIPTAPHYRVLPQMFLIRKKLHKGTSDLSKNGFQMVK